MIRTIPSASFIEQIQLKSHSHKITGTRTRTQKHAQSLACTHKNTHMHNNWLPIDEWEWVSGNANMQLTKVRMSTVCPPFQGRPGKKIVHTYVYGAKELKCGQFWCGRCRFYVFVVRTYHFVICLLCFTFVLLAAQRTLNTRTHKSQFVFRYDTFEPQSNHAPICAHARTHNRPQSISQTAKLVM